MATINIPLRTLQRSAKEFTGLLAVNPKTWFNVLGQGGEVLFTACLDPIGDTKPARSGDSQNEAFMSTGDNIPVNAGDKCEACKTQSKELRKLWEEGIERRVCIVCALKAKKNWHKLELC